MTIHNPRVLYIICGIDEHRDDCARVCVGVSLRAEDIEISKCPGGCVPHV